MSTKRSCHFTEESHKYVDDYFKAVGYKSFNTALNAIIEQHRLIKEWRAEILNKLQKDIHFFKIKPEELFVTPSKKGAKS